MRELAAKLLKRENALFGALVLAMHLFFLVSALWHQSYLVDDSIQYLTLAENWWKEAVFSQSYASPFVPDVQRSPGYPAFLLLLGRIPWLILLVQHLLVLASAWLLYQCFEVLGRAKAGRGMSRLYLLQPYPMIFASMVLSETLFIFLLMAAFLFLLKFWKAKEGKYLPLALGMMALAAHVRPVALPLLAVFVVLALLELVVNRRDFALKSLGIVLGIALVAAWMWRNEQITGKMQFSSMGDMGMVHGRLGGLVAQQKGLDFHEHNLYMGGDSIAAGQIGLGNIRSYPAGMQTHETEFFADGLTGLTFSYFLQHPWEAMKFQFRTMADMFQGLGYGWAGLVSQNKVAALAFAGIQFVCNLLMFFSCFLAIMRFKEWQFSDRLAFWCILIVLLVSSAAWADGRYRVVVDPLMLMLGGFVLHRQHKNALSAAR